jgi:Flp pilus assembly protein TadD
MSAPVPPDLTAAVGLVVRGAREALKLGAWDVAEALAREALVLDPTHAEAKTCLGRIRFHAQDYRAAIRYLSGGLCPDADPDAWLELARAHQTLLEWDSAIAAFLTAFKLRAPTATQEAELGHAYGNSGKFAAAASAFARSVAMQSDSAETWNDLGAMQLEMGDINAACTSFAQAVALRPDYVQAINNLGIANEFKGDSAAVLSAAERLVALKPNDPAFLQKRGVARLANGMLKEGWIDYRARFANPAHKGWHVGIPVPMWDGVSPLADKTILVWSDQGLGEQLLTASLLPDVLAAAKRVVFSCEPRLAPLIARAFPAVRTVSLFDVPFGRADLTGVDVQASISELGPAFRPDFAQFPKHAGFLKADLDQVAALKARYMALPGQGPLVGISWRSTNALAKGNKTIDLAQWGPVLTMPGVKFVSLQYGDVAAETASARGQVFVDPHIDPIKNVDAFAAQVAAMDVVVSISNTTVHMAGALNVPTLCLTPLVEGRPWYWFASLDVSPWYPSVRHIWQTQRRRWDNVMVRAAVGLRALIAR